MTTILIGIGIFVLLVVILVDGFVIIRQQEEAVVEFLGRYIRKMRAGFNLKIPFLEKVIIRDTRVQQLDVTVETKTKDDVFVTLKVSTQYKIVDINKAIYQLANPEQQLESYIFDVVRSQVPNLILDDVFSKKDDIAQAVKQELEEAMDNFGFTIIKSLVTDIDPDSRVKEAMNEINMAKRLRLAATEKGEAIRIEIVKKAQADAESKKLQGEGIANQRKAILDGLRESMKELSDATGISIAEVQSLIMTTQYFDTLKSMSENTNTNTVFMPSNAGAASDIHMQILSALKGNSQSNSVNNTNK